MSQPDQKTLRAASAPAPSTGADGAGAAENPRKCRFSVRQKAAAVERLIRRESIEAVSRDLGVPAHRLSEWRGRFLAGAENAFKERIFRHEFTLPVSQPPHPARDLIIGENDMSSPSTQSTPQARHAKAPSDCDWITPR